MKAAEEEDREKTKFGFKLNHEVTWTFDDKHVPKGSVGTVVGFTENHVKVKFSSGTWKSLRTLEHYLQDVAAQMFLMQRSSEAT